MTIKITYASGATETYTGCTDFTNNGSVVAFRGKLSGQDQVKSWQINWSLVAKLEMTP